MNWDDFTRSQQYQDANDYDKERQRNQFIQQTVDQHGMNEQQAQSFRQEFDRYTAPRGNVYSGTLNDMWNSAASGALSATADTASFFTGGTPNTISKSVRGYADAMAEDRSPSTIEAVENFGFGDDQEITGKGLLYGGLSGLGSTVPMMAGGGLLGAGLKGGARLASGYGKAKKALEATDNVADATGAAGRLGKLDRRIDTIGGGAGYGITGGAMVGGGAGNQTYQEVMALDDQTLLSSPEFQKYYRETYQQTPDNKRQAFDAAKAQLASDLAQGASNKAAVVGGASMALLGPQLQKIIQGKGAQGFFKNTGAGAGTEAIQETIEGGGQQLSTNSELMNVDNRGLWQDVGNVAATGALLGSVSGGMMAAPGGALNRNKPIALTQEQISEQITGNQQTMMIAEQEIPGFNNGIAQAQEALNNENENIRMIEMQLQQPGADQAFLDEQLQQVLETRDQIAETIEDNRNRADDAVRHIRELALQNVRLNQQLKTTSNQPSTPQSQPQPQPQPAPEWNGWDGNETDYNRPINQRGERGERGERVEPVRTPRSNPFNDMGEQRVGDNNGKAFKSPIEAMNYANDNQMNRFPFMVQKVKDGYVLVGMPDQAQQQAGQAGQITRINPEAEQQSRNWEQILEGQYIPLSDIVQAEQRRRTSQPALTHQPAQAQPAQATNEVYQTAQAAYNHIKRNDLQGQPVQLDNGLWAVRPQPAGIADDRRTYVDSAGNVQEDYQQVLGRPTPAQDEQETQASQNHPAYAYQGDDNDYRLYSVKASQLNKLMRKFQGDPRDKSQFAELKKLIQETKRLEKSAMEQARANKTPIATVNRIGLLQQARAALESKRIEEFNALMNDIRQTNLEEQSKLSGQDSSNNQNYDSRLSNEQYRQYLQMTAEEVQAEEVLNKARAKASKGKGGKVQSDDTLLTAIGRLGGLRTDTVEDTVGESIKFWSKNNGKGLSGRFLNKNGLTLDDMGRILSDYGYYDANGQEYGANSLTDAITEEIAGRPRFSQAMGDYSQVAGQQQASRAASGGSNVTAPAVQAALAGEPLSPAYRKEVSRILDEAEFDPAFDQPEYLSQQAADIEQSRRDNAVTEDWYDRMEPVALGYAEGKTGLDSETFNEADWELVELEARELSTLADAEANEQANQVEDNEADPYQRTSPTVRYGAQGMGRENRQEPIQGREQEETKQQGSPDQSEEVTPPAFDLTNQAEQEPEPEPEPESTDEWAHLNLEALKSMGSEWERNGRHRIYFNDLDELYGLKYNKYNTGNISSAWLNGEKISNSQARKLREQLSGKLWYDVVNSEFNSSELSNDVETVLIDAIKSRVEQETKKEAEETDQEVTPPAFDLTTQTEQELQAQAEKQQAAEAQQRQQETQAQQKAEADREADDFVLSGSDSASDQAADRGQSDLLDGQSSSTDQTTAPANDVDAGSVAAETEANEQESKPEWERESGGQFDPMPWSKRDEAITGQWVAYDHPDINGTPIGQIRELDVNELYMPELDENGQLRGSKRNYLEQYTERLKNGEKAPVIEVIEMENGRLRVIDGHRRVMAARANGNKTIKAIVGPLTEHEGSKVGLTKELAATKPERRPEYILRKITRDTYNNWMKNTKESGLHHGRVNGWDIVEDRGQEYNGGFKLLTPLNMTDGGILETEGPNLFDTYDEAAAWAKQHKGNRNGYYQAESKPSEQQAKPSSPESKPSELSAKVDDDTLNSEYHYSEAQEAFQHSNRSAPEAYREEFVKTVQEVAQAALLKAETNQQKAALNTAIQQFKADYLQAEKDYFSVRSGVASSNIAGRNNFNGRQAERRGAADDKALEQLTNRINSIKHSVELAVSDARTTEQKQRDNEAAADKRKKDAIQKHTVSAARYVGEVANAMRENKTELAKSYRQTFMPKAFEDIQKAMDVDRAETIKVLGIINKTVEDLGGLLKVVGARSKLGKLYRDIQAESSQSNENPASNTDNGILLRVNGQPFSSERSAKASKHFKTNPGASVVEVDGGYGVQTSIENSENVYTSEKHVKKTAKTIHVPEQDQEIIDDFGEKIGGARKDIWAKGKLDKAALQDADIIDFQKKIKKEKIFPLPDYKALVEKLNEKISALRKEGEAPKANEAELIAYTVKMIRDSIPQPSKNWTKDEYLEYVESVEKVKDYLTETDGLGIFDGNKIFQDMFGPDVLLRGGKAINRNSRAGALLSRLGNKFLNTASVNRWNLSRYLHKVKTTGWPNTGPSWERNRIIKEDEDGRWRIFNPATRMEIGRGFETRDDASDYLKSRKSDKFIIKENGKDNFTIYRTTSKGLYTVQTGFVSETAAQEYMDLNDHIFSRSNRRKLIKPHLEDMRREGTDYRQGKNVTPEQFQKELGFRGVEFGKWLPDEERQDVLNMSYDAFLDLAEVVGIPKEAISLNGELALAFGSRGTGGEGAGAAHYEPGRVVINLTRLSGAGSLAHEWFHALDNYFQTGGQDIPRLNANYQTDMNYNTGFGGSASIRQEVFDEWNKLINTLTSKSVQKEVGTDVEGLTLRNIQNATHRDSKLESIRRNILADTSDWNKRYKAPTDTQIAELDKLIEQVKNDDVGARTTRPRGRNKHSFETLDKIWSLSKKIQNRDNYDQQLAYLIGGIKYNKELIAANTTKTVTQDEMTRYKRESIRNDSLSASNKHYWAKKIELAARAFEAYVQDSVQVSDYLVHGTGGTGREYDDFDVYPQGQERTDFNEQFKVLFDTIKYRKTDKGTQLYKLGNGLASRGTLPFSTAQDIAQTMETELGVQVNVALNESYLPEGVQAGMERDGLSGVKGVYDQKTGQAWIIANNITTEEEATKTILHEVAGHQALTNMLGKTMNSIMGRIHNDMPPTIRKKLEREYSGQLQGINPASQKAVIAEEYLAHLAETNPTSSTLKRFISKVRRVLRKAFPSIKWTNDDVTELLQTARQKLKAGRSQGSTNQGSTNQGSSNRYRLAASSVMDGLPDDIARDIKKNNAGVQQQEGIVERVKRWYKELELGAKATWEEYGRKAYAGMIDQFDPIARMEKQANSGKLKEAKDSAYKATLRTKNLDGIMTAVLGKGTPTLENGSVTVRQGSKGMLEIFEPLAKSGQLEVWEHWASAQRAQRLLSEGRENLFDQAQIDRINRYVNARPELKQQFESVHKDYQQFNKEILDFAEQAGLIDNDNRQLWEHDDYIPFHRVNRLEDDKPTGLLRRKGLSNQKSGIKRLEGGVERISPMEGIYRNTASLIDASMKNIAMQRITDIGVANGVMEKASTSTSMTSEQAMERLRELGIIEENETVSPQQLERWKSMLVKFVDLGDGAVKVSRDGKTEVYQVHDPELLETMQAMGPDTLNGILKLFAAPKKLLTAMVTSDPGFMARNFIRDTLSTWMTVHPEINGQPLHGSMIDAMKNVASGMESDDHWSLMMAGGGSGGFYQVSPDNIRSKLTPGQMKAHHRRAIDNLGNAWRGWQKIGARTENANRLAVFSDAISKGASVAEAAHQAQDIMNFTRRGKWQATRILTEIIPFLNARIQGMDRLVRGGIDNPSAMFTRGLIYTAASIALWSLFADDERYKSLPEHEKLTWHHFWDGEGNHYRIPKPFEMGAVFATVPEVFNNVAFNGEDGEWAGKMIGGMFTDVFALSAPQFIAPALDIASNRNSFTGAPILSLGMQYQMPESQYTPWTSETTKALAEAMPDAAPEWMRSPKRLEYLLRGYFGTLGSYAMMMSDYLARQARGAPDRPESGIRNMPVIGSFLRGKEQGATRYSTEMYDMLREANTLSTTIKKFTDQGRLDEVAALENENDQVLERRIGLNRYSRKISKLRKEVRTILDSRYTSAALKKQRIDQLNREINELYQEAIRAAE